MSIVLIDNVLFNDNLEERTIRYNNCIVFLILNGTSMFFGLFYLYIYFMIPKYNNISNSLSFFLSLFHLISNSFYFIIFFELYLYEQNFLSLTIKIITMFNPLIILCIYYWAACITHNLYACYYNYTDNMDKRFMNYQYLSFIIMVVFYLYTLFNINYSDELISSKNFTFISNYSLFFIQFFYVSGLCTILFIIYKLYFVLNKKADFIVNEYQETKERGKKLKNIFKSVISRNIAYVIYFLLAFLPENIIMILKYVLDKNIKSYFFEFFVIILISFFSSFLFLVKLFDPLMRNLIVNLLLFNRGFIYNPEINNENNNAMNTPLLNANELNGYLNNKTKTFIQSRTVDIKKIFLEQLSSSQTKKIENKSEGNMDMHRSKLSNPAMEMSYNSEQNKNEFFGLKNNYKYQEMKSFNFSENKNNPNFNLNINKDSSSNKYDSSREESNITIKRRLDKPLNQEYKIIIRSNNDSYNNFNNNNYVFEEQKSNTENYAQDAHSFRQRPIKPISRNISKSSKKNPRNNSIFLTKSYNNKFTTLKNPTNKMYINTNRLNNSKSTIHIRYNSIKSSNMQRKINKQKPHPSRRSISKTNFNYLHEEITSFESINHHKEENENLLRMIAISIAVNDCRNYDKEEKYQEYYKTTLPWENTSYYTERTKIKEYNDANIPSWLGIKNNSKFTGVQFSIMSYCPFVFHHIRLIDKISIDDLLLSLNPIKNIEKLKEQRVLGGRGNNSIFRTWDKKFILKTIDSNEKQIFFDKMIIKFHCFMSVSNSILSRIYGLYKIELIDKGSRYVILQKNMDDLPVETKLLTFDFKGSTAERQVIAKCDNCLPKEKLWEKYKNKVLKDVDLNITGLKFILNSKDCSSLLSIIDSDSSFLENLYVTDYSLVVFVHKYRKEDIEKNKESKHIIASKDLQYIFNFCIVDFLGPYNIIKKGEKFAKNIFACFQNKKDKNFSVSPPKEYGVRFRNLFKRIILDK